MQKTGIMCANVEGDARDDGIVLHLFGPFFDGCIQDDIPCLQGLIHRRAASFFSRPWQAMLIDAGVFPYARGHLHTSVFYVYHVGAGTRGFSIQVRDDDRGWIPRGLGVRVDVVWKSENGYDMLLSDPSGVCRGWLPASIPSQLRLHLEAGCVFMLRDLAVGDCRAQGDGPLFVATLAALYPLFVRIVPYVPGSASARQSYRRDAVANAWWPPTPAEYKMMSESGPA